METVCLAEKPGFCLQMVGDSRSTGDDVSQKERLPSKGTVHDWLNENIETLRSPVPRHSIGPVRRTTPNEKPYIEAMIWKFGTLPDKIPKFEYPYCIIEIAMTEFHVTLFLA